MLGTNFKATRGADLLTILLNKNVVTLICKTALGPNGAHFGCIVCKEKTGGTSHSTGKVMRLEGANRVE